MTAPEHTRWSCCHYIPAARTLILQFDVLTSSWKKKITGEHTSKNLHCNAMFSNIMNAHTHIHKQSSHQCIQIQWLEQSHSHRRVFLTTCYVRTKPFGLLMSPLWSGLKNKMCPLPFDYFSNQGLKLWVSCVQWVSCTQHCVSCKCCWVSC